MVDLSLEIHPCPHRIPRHSVPLAIPRLPDHSSASSPSYLINVAMFQGPVFSPLLSLPMHSLPPRFHPRHCSWGKGQCALVISCSPPATATSQCPEKPAPPLSSRISSCSGFFTMHKDHILGFHLDFLSIAIKSPCADSSYLIFS